MRSTSTASPCPRSRLHCPELRFGAGAGATAELERKVRSTGSQNLERAEADEVTRIRGVTCGCTLDLHVGRGRRGRSVTGRGRRAACGTVAAAQASRSQCFRELAWPIAARRCCVRRSMLPVARSELTDKFVTARAPFCCVCCTCRLSASPNWPKRDCELARPDASARGHVS